MEIKVDDVSLFELSETQEKVFAHVFSAGHVNGTVKEFLASIVNEKHKRVYERMRKEWIPKLETAGITEIPTNEIEFSQLVFSQPEYKDRATKDEESGEATP